MPPINAEKILDYLNSSIICLNDDLIINQVNATAEVFFDNSAKALTGRPFADLFDPRADNSILESLHYCREYNHQMTEHESTMTLANHKIITTDYTIHPISEIDYLSLLVEIQPIDRLLEIARDGQRINQQIASQQMARGMAHEIKNPLGGIRGAAQLLEGEINNPALSEYTDVIIREADRLQSLLNSMLGPNKKMHPASVNILEVLEHVLQLVLAEFPTVCIERDYDPSIPQLMADKNQLIQAFLNLMRNAAQAVEPDGKIILRTRITSQHTIGNKRYQHVMQVDVCDNGPGIDEDVLDNIFLPMVTSKANGTGLGLPIAQQIIIGHHGIIQCQRDEEYTLFTTLLPLEPHDS